jgi:CRISPR-associated endonuclease/helicase Cas3
MTVEQHAREFGYGPEVIAQLAVLWGKSKGKAGGVTNLLLSHLLDTAAVAELMWDGFLAPATHELLDAVAGGPGRGRRLFLWLCGVHDCGKATPAFQRLDPERARAVRAAGLEWREEATARTRWRHDRAGGNLIRSALRDAQWQPEQVEWVWPLVAGHHGLFPSAGSLAEPLKARGQLQGRGAWREAQRAVLSVFSRELGFENLSAVEPVAVPSRAAQLHLSGLVVMADWIASDERHFRGIDDLRRVGLETSRTRARKAWEKLGLRGGWGALQSPGAGFFEDRFGHGRGADGGGQDQGGVGGGGGVGSPVRRGRRFRGDADASDKRSDVHAGARVG